MCSWTRVCPGRRWWTLGMEAITRESPGRCLETFTRGNRESVGKKPNRLGRTCRELDFRSANGADEARHEEVPFGGREPGQKGLGAAQARGRRDGDAGWRVREAPATSGRARGCGGRGKRRQEREHARVNVANVARSCRLPLLCLLLLQSPYHTTCHSQRTNGALLPTSTVSAVVKGALASPTQPKRFGAVALGDACLSNVRPNF